MPAATLAILGVAIIATSFLSGIFGMAGGLILLAVCLSLLEVAPAMILHAASQSAANAWRAVIWHRSLVWPILWRYALATSAVFIAMRFIAYMPSKAMIYLLLGALPFVTDFLPQRFSPDIERSGAPYICGLAAGLLQLLAGVGGNVVDIFFQRSTLDRKQIVATKSATQAFGHVLRIAYFGSLTSATENPVPAWGLVAAVALAMSGTTLAGSALGRMSDADFRRYSAWIIRAVGLVLIARGSWILLAG